jgi:hypothetical protein
LNDRTESAVPRGAPRTGLRPAPPALPSEPASLLGKLAKAETQSTLNPNPNPNPNPKRHSNDCGGRTHVARRVAKRSSRRRSSRLRR